MCDQGFIELGAQNMVGIKQSLLLIKYTLCTYEIG